MEDVQGRWKVFIALGYWATTEGDQGCYICGLGCPTG